MGTARGYTGQYSDPLTGLDYYVSRYYDPVAGVFLSADVKEGNAQGMNPYAYVAQNPETLTDPSGQMYAPPPCCGDPLPPPSPPPPPNHGPTCGPDPSCYGGGSSGNNSSPTPHAKKVILRCNVECQNEKTAQQLAKNAAGFFGFLANVLSDLENWISLDTLFGWDKQAESLITFFEGAFASLGNPTVGGFIAALPRLASIAQDIANGFAAEANHSLGWFTQQHVQDAGLNAIDTAEAEGYKDMMEAAGAVVAGIVISLVSDGLLAEFGATLAAEGTAAEFVIGGGLNIMEDYASGVIFVQQENLYTASITV